jgi:hypothetical protein
MKSKRHAIVLFFALIVTLFTSTDLAASPAPLIQPPQEQRPKFFTHQRIVLLSVGAAMMAADIITTQRALEVPGTHEMNPLGQSEAARYALKFAGVGAGTDISYALHHTGHYKAARIVTMFIGAPSLAAALHNTTIRK